MFLPVKLMTLLAVRGGWIVLAKVEGIVGEVNSSDIVIIATDLTE
jgi:hypothetical protein